MAERALLVSVKMKSEKDTRSLEDITEELEELAETSGAETVDVITATAERPTPNFFIGRGKAQEIALVSEEEEIDTVIFSCDLSGTHQRNLEEAIEKKTVDRTQLILDIFSKHARSPEGKMQVELAQLGYLLPRLSGKGVMLSRLGGGIGTRGPGEQKLEVDRRRIRKRIDKLKQDLRDFALHRATIKKKRKEKEIPTVALVGYTNAGKSTLLNALTNAGQITSPGLFTTLDPLSKRLQMPNGERLVLSDTVGFLHNLPHRLIEAFKATLEEVVEADLLINVLDVSHPLLEERNRDVLAVLSELGAQQKSMLTVLNKVDLLDDKTWLGQLQQRFPRSVAISAKLKQNLDELVLKIQEHFASRMSYINIVIPHSRMDLVDLFYREGKVLEIKFLQAGIKVRLWLPELIKQKLLHNNEIKIIS